MARINIEDSLYKDDRFLDLIAVTGNIYIAKGMILSAFTLAQKYWLKHKSVPIKAWPKSLQPLIDCGLAEADSKGTSIYVRGSREQFGWLEKSSKGGKSKSEKKLKNLKNTKIQNETNEVSLEGSSKGQQALYSLLSSHYSNSLISQNEKIPEPNGSGKPEKKKIDKINTKPLWDAYEKAYFKRWETKPLRNQKSNSQMMQFAKRVGVEDAPKVLEFYVRHNEAKYIASMHSIGYALTDAESLYVQWKRNFAITFNDIRQSQYEASRG